MSRIKRKFIQFGTASEDVNSEAIPNTFSPTNFTPSEINAEGTNKISAFLKGIDNKFGSMSGQKFVGDLTFNGTDTSKDVNVSASITDARQCVAQLLDVANNFDRIYCNILAISASIVRIDTGTNKLPAGTYRLIVVG